MISTSPQNHYKKVLLLTPPMTQLNTPYPATGVLTGFLKARGITALQDDFSIKLVMKLFSKTGLELIRSELLNLSLKKRSDSAQFFLSAFEDYKKTIEIVTSFLQGKDPSIAHRIANRKLLPEGPRFLPLSDGLTQENLGWAFGKLGIQDKAKFMASLYLDDLTDVINQNIDPRFSISRYGEKLSASQPSFDFLYRDLQKKPTLVETLLEELTLSQIKALKPDLVGLTAPFPGNVFGAFIIARTIKKYFPKIKILFGGGYANTELRSLTDPRVFEYFDFITLDDGERPLLTVVEFLSGIKKEEELVRTFICKDSKVLFINNPLLHDIPQNENGIPSYEGLPLDQYLSILELLNPMHRIWSDARWNKLTLAHGCYWKKCNFCDVNLDYIGRYEASSVDLIIERIKAIISETGTNGFHFVDEAAPPALLKKLAQKLIEENIVISWWGNIRFEKSFTKELAELLSDSGCIALSGGLEVASNRLLDLMNKGVSVEQVAQVTKNLNDAGILVHAYLMYGFPSQTTEETIDALERVRQLFLNGCITSAYWHRFSATIHSPIGKNPEFFGVNLLEKPRITFAENDLPFLDEKNKDKNLDLDMLGKGLRKSLYNYMHGIGLEEDARFWFDTKVPKSKVPANLISESLN